MQALSLMSVSCFWVKQKVGEQQLSFAEHRLHTRHCTYIQSLTPITAQQVKNDTLHLMKTCFPFPTTQGPCSEILKDIEYAKYISDNFNVQSSTVQ